MNANERRSAGPDPQPRVPSRGAPRLALALAGVGVLGLVLTIWSYLGEDRPPTVPEAISGVSILLALLAFIVSGTVIVARQPRNVIGWLLVIPGLTLPFSEVAVRWLAGLEPAPTEASPALWLLLWASSIAWMGLIFPIFHILLTLPSGRLLSSRWRAAVALELAMIALLCAISAFTTVMGPTVDGDAGWTVPNPIGFLPPDALDGVFGTAWEVGLVTLCVLGGAAVVLRFRRGSRDERQQLKWPLLGGIVFGLTYGGAAIQGEDVGPWFAVGIAAIPVTIAIAVTRYRLYELDRIIGRTIAYGLVTALLGAAFLATNLALQAVLHRGTTFEVAVSTLVVAMLFQPLRRAVQRPIDRRFNRSRVDAERMVAAFATRTRDQVDLPTLASELSATAARAVEPSSTAIWIRRGDTVRNRSHARAGAQGGA